MVYHLAAGCLYSLLPSASETGDEEGAVAVTAAGEDALHAWPVLHISHPVAVDLGRGVRGQPSHVINTATCQLCHVTCHVTCYLFMWDSLC